MSYECSKQCYRQFSGKHSLFRGYGNRFVLIAMDEEVIPVFCFFAIYKAVPL